MRKVLFSLFFLFHVFVFSQTNPLASDISTAHYKDTDGSIHLVGSDSEYGTLTYTIVTLPSHGTIKDPLNGDAVISAGGTLSGDVLTFVPDSDENHKYIFSGTTSFTYKVTDSGGLESNVKTVTVKVFDSYLNPPTLIGAEINGDAVEDGFGRSVSLSEDGTIMAVGAPFNDAGTSNSDKGHVKVFKYDGSAWSQIGSDLDGTTSQDYFGSSVSLSEDGTILAVGIPYNDVANSNAGQVKTYLYDSGSSTWNLTGTITPTIVASGSNKAVSEQFGNDVRLSSDGKTLAVSDIWFDRSGGSNQGRVVVYRYDGTNWNSLGNETALYGESGDNFSYGLSLSANGNIMAIGVHDYSSNNKGQVKIYEYDYANTEWDVKATLLGDKSTEKFGAAVDLSSDGLILAVGAPYHRISGSGSEFLGKVSVYKWNGTSYVAYGSDLIGSDKYDFFGAQLSLDNEGNTLAVMGPGHDATSGSTYLNKGRVRVYNYDASSTSWVQSPVSYDFDGEADGDQSASGNAESKGQRVFLSGDGSVLAIGADQNDGNGTDSGHVRVYKLFEVQQIPVANSQSVSFTLYEQVTSSEEITLTGTDGDSGPNTLVYIITELNTAKLYEGGTEITSADIPYTLSANKVKYNSNSDVAVSDSFKFIVHDGKASSVPAAVTLTIIPDNDPPIATAQSVTSDEDVAVDITLAGSDVDTSVSNLSYLIYSLPSSGTLTDKNNSDAAVSLVDRDNGTTDSASVNKLVDSTQDFTSTVQAGDFILNTTDNTYADVKAVDDNNSLSISADIMASGEDYTIKRGTNLVVVSGTTKVTFTPNSNFAGSDSFKFKARDKGVNDDSSTDVENSVDAATVSITVNNTDNDPPVAENQTLSANEETETGTITLVAADPAPDDTTLTYSIASLPINGKLKDGGTVITALGDLTGALTYLPNSDFIGTDTFKFTAKDDESTPAVSNQATVTINVSDANDPPVAQNQSLTTDEETETATITLTATDPDPSDTVFTFVISSLPTNGILKDGGITISTTGNVLSGALTYLPTNNFVSTDTFTFKARDDESLESTSAATVSISVNDVNDPPVAKDQAVSTKEDITTDPVITLEATDPDPTDTSFTYTITELPLNGVLKDGSTDVNSAGTDLSGATLTYTPNSNYNGNDTFKFTATDDENASSASATVTLTVTPWNDPPKADPQVLTADENTALPITITGTDVDGDALTYIIYSLPTNGILKQGGATIVAADLPKTLSSTDISYVPNTDYKGEDAFKFKVRDMTPASFASTNDMIFINSGGTNVTFETEFGKTYYLIQNTATKMDWPVAKDLTDSFYGARMYIPRDANIEKTVFDAIKSMNRLDGPFWMGLYQDRNASDYSEPSGGWTWVDGVKLGSSTRPYVNWRSGEPNDAGTEDYGQFNFWAGFKEWNDMSVGNGQSYALFEFTAEDSTAEIKITVKEVNDPPIANNQSVETNEDTPLTIKLTGSGPENDPLTYLIKSLPTNGKIKEGGNEILASELPRLLPADSLSYHPNADYNGSDSFDFMINANFLNSFTKANGLKYITQDGVPVTYQKPEGKTYFLIQEGTGVSGNPIDWTTARDLTNTIEGAKMYVVLNAEMELLVWNGLKSMGLTGKSGLYYWLGLYQDKTSPDYAEPGLENQNWGGWTWVDGVTLKERGYYNWFNYPSEPNNAGAEDYAQFEFSSNGPNGIQWNDMSIGNAQSWPLFEFSINNSTDSNTAKISINVKSVNDMPIAEDQSLTTLEDTPLNITLNATDPEGIIEMAYVVKSLPSNGDLLENTTVIAANDLPKTLTANTLKYQPSLDYNGNDSFTFYAKDKNCPNTNTSTLTVSGDFTASASGTNPMVIPPQTIKGTESVNQKQVDIKFSVGQGDIFQSCEIKLDVRSFDDGLQFTINGTKLLNFNQFHWDSATGAKTTEFNGSGKFVTSGSTWTPWSGQGNPKLEIATGKIKLMVDTKDGGREDALPYMDTTVSEWALVSSFTYDCEAGFNLLIGNQNHGGPGGLDADLTVEAYIVPCEESNVAKVSIAIDPVNDPPESDPQTVDTDEDVPVDITHVGRDKDLVNIFTVHTQMGKDLQLPDYWGEFIELSADGKAMVIGGWTNNKVKVFGWDGTDWNQIGSDIDGSASGDNFGEFVSISSDGKRIAVGAHKHDSNKGQVRAFEWDGTIWSQLGNEMLGSATGDESSLRGVHMSGDGKVIAAASFKQGYVDTYKWDGSSWTKTGVISITKAGGDAPGQVSLSNDGNRLAIGSAAGSGNKGQVKIFDWDGTNTWNQYAVIDGKNNGDKFGNTLSISRDGKNIAVGVNGAGSARVYDLSGSNPTQVGNDINYGSNAAWRAISLADDGNRIAIPVLNQKTGVFDWDGTSWNKMGEDLIKPPSSPSLWGESMDMSSDGKTLVIGGHNGFVQVFNILNLTYIITTYPSNGILKEGSKTITPAELPFTLKGTDATYVPNPGFFGQDKYNFKVNDGKADSTDKVSGLREDSQVTINIKEFILELPNNYTITPTETCKGSDFGILDIEVAATSYKKTASGPDIPITYKISIEGKGELATIVSPNKTAQITGLPAGKHKLIFKVVQEPKYEEIIEVEIIASDPPVAYAVPKLEVCDDDADGDDNNGKVNFDTSTILNTLLKNPSTGTVQDEKLFDIEFTYFDDATSANVTKPTLPNPLYSASQTVSVKFISKINGNCIAEQTIDFQVNSLPVFERIEDVKSVCTNLDPVTIGVASKDSRTYTYTWTRNGTAFAPNIAGIDSSILIGLGGEYIVTATTTDGTNCSKTMTIQIKESSIANLLQKDIVIKDLNPGPNNTITVLTETLGIGDYEYALDDITGPYQDSPVFEKVRPGSHTVYVRDKNDCGIANMNLIVIGYKKFFTPNGDGYTDKWNIIGITKDNLPKSKIYIFDRYEKLIKELDPLSDGWDGTFLGNPMPQTDYWFKVLLEDGRELKGHFSLIRAW